jgi:CRISPR-associated endonuclease/helicase Cas3
MESLLTKEALAHLTAEGRPHLLLDHLRAVATLSATFAKPLQAEHWAYLAGLWHDLGKYAGNFQKMIREANGFAAHIEGDASGPRDHSTAGAIHALQTVANGKPIAYVIAGHHAGLSDTQPLKERCEKKKERYDSAKKGGAPVELLNEKRTLTAPTFLQTKNKEHSTRQDLWIRMLFSALCDADFLDTERFYDDTKTALRGGGASLDILAAKLREHLTALQAKATTSAVNEVRAEVLDACYHSASLPPGFFSLTVPTGGGKTLAGMAFALEHAKQHNLRRIVVAIPYTSIIEQSAKVYRDAFSVGDGSLIEHHSALDPAQEKETPQSRISSDNWDAPIIVTTNVQLLESLFANRPSSCRKLHNIAQSVIIFDEAQTMPPGLLRPILDVLSSLVSCFGCSVVISTATQPALGRSSHLPEGLQEVREIVPPSINAFSRLRRVKAHWPTSEEPTTYEALAAEVAKERDVLVITHLRKDARELCEALDRILGHKETLHLSALMCPEHRSQKLAEIKARKKKGEAVRVVSTQLVEAGVDLDFPVVYRALGGLDAMAQAAGRCNREGKLHIGELRLFHAPTKPPPGVPVTALAVTQGLLRQHPDLDLFDPAIFQTYFARLYNTRDTDQKQIQEERVKLNFKTVAERFHMIEDGYSAPLVVLYGAATSHLDELAKYGPSRDRLRALQRFTVSVPQKLLSLWLAQQIAVPISERVNTLHANFTNPYDDRFGLILEKIGVGTPSLFII